MRNRGYNPTDRGYVTFAPIPPTSHQKKGIGGDDVC